MFTISIVLVVFKGLTKKFFHMWCVKCVFFLKSRQAKEKKTFFNKKKLKRQAGSASCVRKLFCQPCGCIGCVGDEHIDDNIWRFILILTSRLPIKAIAITWNIQPFCHDKMLMIWHKEFRDFFKHDQEVLSRKTENFFDARPNKGRGGY